MKHRRKYFNLDFEQSRSNRFVWKEIINAQLRLTIKTIFKTTCNWVYVGRYYFQSKYHHQLLSGQNNRYVSPSLQSLLAQTTFFSTFFNTPSSSCPELPQLPLLPGSHEFLLMPSNESVEYIFEFLLKGVGTCN